MIGSCQNSHNNMSDKLDKLDKDDFNEYIQKANDAIRSNDFSNARMFITKANQNITDEQDEIMINEAKLFLQNKEAEENKRIANQKRIAEQEKIIRRNRNNPCNNFSYEIKYETELLKETFGDSYMNVIGVSVSVNGNVFDISIDHYVYTGGMQDFYYRSKRFGSIYNAAKYAAGCN